MSQMPGGGFQRPNDQQHYQGYMGQTPQGMYGGGPSQGQYGGGPSQGQYGGGPAQGQYHNQMMMNNVSPHTPPSSHQNYMAIRPPDKLIGEAQTGPSTVFFGNISYDCHEDELKRTLRTVGPYRDFKPMFGDDNKPKGFGFCTYNDPDTAASSIRNLNKLSINSRDLKVHFANDKQSEQNLKLNDVKYRDASEIISGTGGVPSHHAMAQGQGLQMGEVLNPSNSSVDDMVRNLSDIQKEMIIFGIQDVCNQQVEQTGSNMPVAQPRDVLIEALSQDETMLVHLDKICNDVIQKLTEECGGEQQIWINDQQRMPSNHSAHSNPYMSNNVSYMGHQGSMSMGRNQPNFR